MASCLYKPCKKKSNSHQTIWTSPYKNSITTETGNYGVVNIPSINYCPHCGKKARFQP